jgi:hypothetical protein
MNILMVVGINAIIVKLNVISCRFSLGFSIGEHAIKGMSDTALHLFHYFHFKCPIVIATNANHMAILMALRLPCFRNPQVAVFCGLNHCLGGCLAITVLLGPIFPLFT